MKRTQTEPLVIEGRTWHLFAIDFDGPDGEFSVYIRALSFEHAELMLQDLKETGAVSGRVIARIEGGEE